MSSGVLEVLQGQDGTAAVEMLLNLLSEAAAGRDVSALAPEIIQARDDQTNRKLTLLPIGAMW